ncbi:unnamed protein product [Paramecium pentaurelia]|uniref:Uncharacterized protein n=1 Tax=Paramecium pentaurelia TaxID=43138 RepID=A0A8S1SSB1_9CILI|nr:unnamed protein product [Paramecium pentaurelia]
MVYIIYQQDSYFIPNAYQFTQSLLILHGKKMRQPVI